MDCQRNPEHGIGISNELLETLLDEPAHDRHHARMGLDLEFKT
jgi:hypothetical protein